MVVNEATKRRAGRPKGARGEEYGVRATVLRRSDALLEIMPGRPKGRPKNVETAVTTRMFRVHRRRPNFFLIKEKVEEEGGTVSVIVTERYRKAGNELVLVPARYIEESIREVKEGKALIEKGTYKPWTWTVTWSTIAADQVLAAAHESYATEEFLSYDHHPTRTRPSSSPSSGSSSSTIPSDAVKIQVLQPIDPIVGRLSKHYYCPEVKSWYVEIDNRQGQPDRTNRFARVALEDSDFSAAAVDLRQAALRQAAAAVAAAEEAATGVVVNDAKKRKRLVIEEEEEDDDAADHVGEEDDCDEDDDEQQQLDESPRIFVASNGASFIMPNEEDEDEEDAGMQEEKEEDCMQDEEDCMQQDEGGGGEEENNDDRDDGIDALIWDVVYDCVVDSSPLAFGCQSDNDDNDNEWIDCLSKIAATASSSE